MKKFPYIVTDAQGNFVKGFVGLVAGMNYAERKGLVFTFNQEYNQ